MTFHERVVPLEPALLQRCLAVYPRLAFVDLETTGSMPGSDGITEVAIIQVDAEGVREWSSLVNPGRPIPPFIQQLTGIDDAMVAGAPSFASLAAEVLARLEGRVFFAHNARFDHGFLAHALEAAGLAWHPPQVSCTVKLSRKLYPEQERHNLDTLITRHRLQVSERHRALGDTRLIWQFWQIACRDFPATRLAAALGPPPSRPGLPAHLDTELPEGHGVYIFHGVDGRPLLVGRATRLRQQVQSLFRTDQGLTAGTRLSEQVGHIETVAAPGTLGAQLKEVALVRSLQPRHHQLPRHRDLPAPRAWPYPGAIGLREGEAVHVLDAWCHLGTATHEREIWPLLEQTPVFDHDIYLVLLKRLASVPVRSVMLLNSQLDFGVPAA
ncbi:exonuclease domain-containing protein [Aquabacterium sp. A7-Y]|uniref:exonuclease domain-containing protein n=1 Tax=Aquabacterium sp. A7-Y TaxID=1349605 RepID=UPI00223DDC44|nr:exonuclease domain-containing protein [Aquabacterium sp. A7-Y]MCW7537072.1 exonuclease domain-containing protein [Aquabacterium sp. A7-Y]